MKKPTFIRCPRCELNYIQKKDKYCAVCKQEMKALGGDTNFEVDEENEMEICPVCKSNYIQEDEIMCASCAKEKALEDGMFTEADAEADWNEYNTNLEEQDTILDNEELGEMVNITEDEDDTDSTDAESDDETDDDLNETDDLDDDLDLDLEDDLERVIAKAE